MKIFNIEDTIIFEEKIFVIIGNTKEITDYVHETFGYDLPFSGTEEGENIFHKNNEDLVIVFLDKCEEEGVRVVDALVHELEHLDTNFRGKTRQDLSHQDEMYVRWWTWLMCNTDIRKAFEYAMSLPSDLKQQ